MCNDKMYKKKKKNKKNIILDIPVRTGIWYHIEDEQHIVSQNQATEHSRRSILHSCIVH